MSVMNLNLCCVERVQSKIRSGVISGVRPLSTTFNTRSRFSPVSQGAGESFSLRVWFLGKSQDVSRYISRHHESPQGFHFSTQLYLLGLLYQNQGLCAALRVHARSMPEAEVRSAANQVDSTGVPPSCTSLRGIGVRGVGGFAVVRESFVFMPNRNRGNTKAQRLRKEEKVRARKRQWFSENGPCFHCGSWENLQADHIVPTGLGHTNRISQNMWYWAVERRESELAKCQVLCRSCHEKKTAIDLRKYNHGISLYRHHGCRCDVCRGAMDECRRKYRAKKLLSVS